MTHMSKCQDSNKKLLENRSRCWSPLILHLQLNGVPKAFLKITKCFWASHGSYSLQYGSNQARRLHCPEYWSIELDKKLEGAGLLNPVVALPPAISFLTLINILQYDLDLLRWLLQLLYSSHGWWWMPLHITPWDWSICYAFLVL